jgi:hypothetical protein
LLLNAGAVALFLHLVKVSGFQQQPTAIFFTFLCDQYEDLRIWKIVSSLQQ